MRQKYPNLFKDLCPESLKEVFSKQLQLVLEDRDRLGRKVFVFRAGIIQKYLN